MSEAEAPFSPFWETFGAFGGAPALIDGNTNEVWSYRRLEGDLAQGRDEIGRFAGRIIFLFADTDVGAVLCYLSALSAAVPVYLSKGKVVWAEQEGLLRAYSPDVLLWKGREDDLPAGYRCAGTLFGYRIAELTREQSPIAAAGDLALLMSTSGSLGSPKTVRLSRTGISTAASQVVRALRLKPAQRAITCLPIHFIYGLSVIHAHLAVGASVVVTQRSVQDRAFWKLLEEQCVTSLSGVPWTFQAIRQLSFIAARNASLQQICVSGGAVTADLANWLTALNNEGVNVYSMYGQTEAGGRMTVLPPELLSLKSGSVGLPVPLGKVECDQGGNIGFRGPNVMLGYAAHREDVSGTDSQKGYLSTGDKGFLDADGCLYITGRTSRIAKLFGTRIDLSEVEVFLGGPDRIAVICDTETLEIFVEGGRSREFDTRLEALGKRTGVPAHRIHVHTTAALPRNGYGKVQYGDLLPKSAG